MQLIASGKPLLRCQMVGTIHPPSLCHSPECSHHSEGSYCSVGISGSLVFADIIWEILLDCMILMASSVHFSPSVVSNVATPWTTARQASLSITNSQSLSKPMSIESMMPSNHLLLSRPLLLLPSIFPSIRVFSSESALHMWWPKYWSLSFNISPFNEHCGLISFRMDWLDLLAVQGTLKSLLQHHSSKRTQLSL